MYFDHFGLREQPFSIAPDPRYLYMSDRHREALAHLVYGIGNEGGFLLLTGEVGTGKTTVCRCLLEQLPADTQVAYITNPRLSANELLATVCDELAIPYPQENSSSKIFIDRLNSFLLAAHAAGRKTVLIIDEAQNLSVDVLEQVRLLTNLETNQRKLLQVILLGQPELRVLLGRPELRQLAQRITARYHLEPLSRTEVAGYIGHRLAVAGARRLLFSRRLLRKIHRLSGGIPRKINLLCDRALMGAYVGNLERVNVGILLKAAREVWDGRPSPVGRWVAALVLAGVTAVLFLELQIAPPTAPVAVLPAAPPPAAVAEPPSPEVLPAPWFSAGREQALRDLLTTWGLAYMPEEHGSACAYAKSFGLDCLFRRGSLGSLRLLDRPAILTLIDSRGGEAYGTLVALAGESATFLLDGQYRSIPVRDLEERWLGDFMLLWRLPPFADGIRPGDRGGKVEWLARQLSALAGDGKEERPSGSGILKGELLDRLKAFQLRRGLEPDGIVGPNTLIHLDSALGGGSPRLSANPEEG